MTLKSYVITALWVPVLASCSLVPEYSPEPLAPLNQFESTASVDGDSQSEHPTLSWRSFFLSEDIQRIIETTLENNRDLKLALLNIEEARALYNVSASDTWPELAVGADATVARNPEAVNPEAGVTRTERYDLSVGFASYELDFFGRVASLNDAALNEFLATREATAVVEQRLIADVVVAYLQWLAAGQQLQMTEAILADREQTLSIIEQSLELGEVAAIEVSRARLAVAVAQANRAQYQRQQSLSYTALRQLIGSDVEIPAQGLDEVTFLDGLPAFASADLLLQRPDIRQAEYQLLARNADIGAARAAFFPSISLTGEYGFASRNLSGLLDSNASGAWSFVPQIRLPIFTRGRNQANLTLAELRKDAAIIEYEQSIETAFREVADGLSSVETYSHQLEAQQQLLNEAESISTATQARYELGADSFLDVINANADWYEYQQAYTALKMESLTSQVSLFTALGASRLGSG